MSSTLFWEPTHRKRGYLSSELKFVLRKRYGNPVDVTLGTADLLYLYGLRDAGVEEADRLVKILEKYDTVILKEDFG